MSGTREVKHEGEVMRRIRDGQGVCVVKWGTVVVGWIFFMGGGKLVTGGIQVVCNVSGGLGSIDYCSQSGVCIPRRQILFPQLPYYQFHSRI